MWVYVPKCRINNNPEIELIRTSLTSNGKPINESLFKNSWFAFILNNMPYNSNIANTDDITNARDQGNSKDIRLSLHRVSNDLDGGNGSSEEQEKIRFGVRPILPNLPSNQDNFKTTSVSRETQGKKQGISQKVKDGSFDGNGEQVQLLRRNDSRISSDRSCQRGRKQGTQTIGEQLLNRNASVSKEIGISEEISNSLSQLQLCEGMVREVPTSISLVSVLESEGLNSESISLSPNQEPFVSSRESLSAVPFLKNECRMESLTSVQSGQMLPHLTASLGVESWISSLRDGRVNHSLQWEKEPEFQTVDLSGQVSHELLKKHNRLSSSEKTSPSTLTSDLTLYPETLHRLVMECKRDYFRRMKWACLKDENDSSLWPTPRASMPAVGNSSRYRENRLEDVLAGWMVEKYEKLTGKKPNMRVRLAAMTNKTGDGSSSVILKINPRFLAMMMNLPQGWSNPSVSIEKDKFELWEMESSRLVQHMLSQYFSKEQESRGPWGFD